MMINLENYTLEQLKDLSKQVNAEISKKEHLEYQKDYKNALSAIKVMADKYPWTDSFDFYDGATWSEIYEKMAMEFEG